MGRVTTIVFSFFRIVLDLVSVLVLLFQFLLLHPYRIQYVFAPTSAFDDDAIDSGIGISGFFLFLQLGKVVLAKGVFGQRVTYWDLFLLLVFLGYLGYWLHYHFSDALPHYIGRLDVQRDLRLPTS